MPDVQEYLHHASELRFKHGFSIVPLQPKNKMPMINWAKYQEFPAGLGEVEKWWASYTAKDKCPNIGVVCGEVSERLIVVDIDPRKGGSVKKVEEVLGVPLPATVQALSGGVDKGIHYYYRDYTGTAPLKTFVLTDGVEVRCDGSVIVVPPSIHPVTGNLYAWKYSPYEYEISQAPNQLLEAAQLSAQRKISSASTGEHGPEPTAEEVQETISMIIETIEEDASEDSGLIYSFLTGDFPHGRVGGWDRSGWAYKLARLLIENAVLSSQEVRKLAVAVFGAAVHEAKFKNRTDRWQDCINIAKEAVAGEVTIDFTSVEEAVEVEVVEDYQEDLGPIFPADCCTGLIGEIAKALSVYSESSLAYLYFSTMAAFSVLVSGNYTLDTSLKVKPVMYTVLLGESGLSRKSVAISSVMEFFKDALEEEFSNRLFSGYFGSGEGVVKKLSLIGEKNPKGLAQMLWYVDEFEEVMSRSGMEGSVLAPVLQQLYEDTNFEYFSLSKSLSVTNAYLSIISASTIDTFNAMWAGKMTEGGLFNRMWLVAPEATNRISMPERAEDNHEPLKERLRVLVEAIEEGPTISVGEKTIKLPHAKRLVMSEEAKEVWSRFYLVDLLGMVREEPECARRLDAYGLRLCVLVSLSKGEFEEVSAETVHEVIRLLQYEYQVRLVLRPPDAKNDLARVEQMIVRKLNGAGEVTRRDLFRLSTCQRYGTGMFEKALENLHKTGFITIKRVKGDRVNVLISLT